MPQDIDGSGLAAVLWAAWFYWWMSRWLSQPASLEHRDSEQQRRSDLSAVGSHAEQPPADAALCRDLEAVVSEICRRDGPTAVDDFLAGAVSAYEHIVTAFNSGDRQTLQALVSAEVYDAFSDAIAARDAQHRSAETVFSRIEPPRIVDGLVEGTHIEVSVRFVGDWFRLLRNDAGDTGNTGARSRRTVDVWTFERTGSPATTWRVVATEAAA